MRAKARLNLGHVLVVQRLAKELGRKALDEPLWRGSHLLQSHLAMQGFGKHGLLKVTDICAPRGVRARAALPWSAETAQPCLCVEANIHEAEDRRHHHGNVALRLVLVPQVNLRAVAVFMLALIAAAWKCQCSAACAG
jgi:hypothetical protein